MKTVKGISDAKIDAARFMWSLSSHLRHKSIYANHMADILSSVTKAFYSSLSEESKEGWFGPDYGIEAITLGQENEIDYLNGMRAKANDPLVKLLFGLLDEFDPTEHSKAIVKMRKSADEAIADIRRKEAEHLANKDSKQPTESK